MRKLNTHSLRIGKAILTMRASMRIRSRVEKAAKKLVTPMTERTVYVRKNLTFPEKIIGAAEELALSLGYESISAYLALMLEVQLVRAGKMDARKEIKPVDELLVPRRKKDRPGIHPERSHETRVR